MTTQPDQPPDLLLVQIESLRAAFDREQRAFRQYAPLGHAKRVDALDALLQSIFRYEDILVEAANTDFGQRSFSETRLLDIFPVVDEIRYVKRNLRRWMQARCVSVNWQFLPSRAKIIYQPLGVVGSSGHGTIQSC